MRRKTNRRQPPLSPPQKSNVTHIESTPDKSDDDEKFKYITSYRQPFEKVYVAAIWSETVNMLERFDAKTLFGSIYFISIINSGNVLQHSHQKSRQKHTKN